MDLKRLFRRSSAAELRAKADRLIAKGNTERALPLRVKATNLERRTELRVPAASPARAPRQPAFPSLQEHTRRTRVRTRRLPPRI